LFSLVVLLPSEIFLFSILVAIEIDAGFGLGFFVLL